MSVPVIKAICRRIEARMGGGKNAALAAGISGALWSQYCSGEHPTVTIPIHRLLVIAEGDERSAIASLFTTDAAQAAANLMSEAMEATEAVVKVQSMVRLATLDGEVTENEARPLRLAVLDGQKQLDDVLRGLG